MRRFQTYINGWYLKYNQTTIIFNTGLSVTPGKNEVDQNNVDIGVSDLVTQTRNGRKSQTSLKNILKSDNTVVKTF